MYSYNGISWSNSASNTLLGTATSVTWNGRYFIAGGSGASNMNYSTDGITWTTLSSGFNNVVALASRKAIPWGGDVRVPSETEITIQAQFNEKSGATGTVTHDYSTGSTFYHSSMAANFTCNITNVPALTKILFTVKLILAQGGTGYYANALQINGSSVTFSWLNNATPTAGTNTIDYQIIEFYYNGSAWKATAEYKKFG